MRPADRRHFSGDEKVKILRLHLVEGKPVSESCEQNKINPSLFYQWQRTFFENGARTFEGSGNGRSETKLEKQVEALASRLQRKHEVLTEWMEEHIRLKRILGRLERGMDRSRHPGRVGRLCAALVGTQRDL
jgi:transposase-like protein